MNKKEFVARLAKAQGVTAAEAEKRVNAFFDVVKEAMMEGEAVVLTGLMTITPKMTPARKFVNPKTKETGMTAPKATVTVKVGSKLKEVATVK